VGSEENHLLETAGISTRKKGRERQKVEQDLTLSGGKISRHFCNSPVWENFLFYLAREESELVENV